MAPGEDVAHRRSLPKAERLRSSQAFRAVFQGGQSFHGSLLVLFLLKQPEAPRRFGVVAGRRVGNAVRRNRAKRLLREAYRALRNELPDKGIEMVLVARRGCDGSSARDVTEQLRDLLGRALDSSRSSGPPARSETSSS